MGATRLKPVVEAGGRAFVLTTRQLAQCPAGAISASHFFSDGRCLCGKTCEGCGQHPATRIRTLEAEKGDRIEVAICGHCGQKGVA